MKNTNTKRSHTKTEIIRSTGIILACALLVSCAAEYPGAQVVSDPDGGESPGRMGEVGFYDPVWIDSSRVGSSLGFESLSELEGTWRLEALRSVSSDETLVLGPETAPGATGGAEIVVMDEASIDLRIALAETREGLLSGPPSATHVHLVRDGDTFRVGRAEGGGAADMEQVGIRLSGDLLSLDISSAGDGSELVQLRRATPEPLSTRGEWALTTYEKAGRRFTSNLCYATESGGQELDIRLDVSADRSVHITTTERRYDNPVCNAGLVSQENSAEGFFAPGEEGTYRLWLWHEGDWAESFDFIVGRSEEMMELRTIGCRPVGCEQIPDLIRFELRE